MTQNSTLYLIAETRRTEDYSGREDTEFVIVADYGYFTDQASAERFAAELDAPALARYNEAMAAFEKQDRTWSRRAKEARKLGFRPSLPSPMRPRHPDLHVIIDVDPVPSEATA